MWSPERLWLVAAHAWDVFGASQAGLVTAWVSRSEQVFHAAMGEPTIRGATLVDVAEALARVAGLTAEIPIRRLEVRLEYRRQAEGRTLPR